MARIETPPIPPGMFGGNGGGRQRRQGGRGERPGNTLQTLRRLWTYLRRQKAAVTLTAAMVAVTVLLDVLGPLLLGRAIDQGILPRDFARLTRITLLMLLVYGASSLLTWLQNYVMSGAAQRTVRDIRADLFAKVQRLPLHFFDQRAHGDLMSRLTQDVENFNQVLSGSVTQIVSGMLSTAGIAVVMLFLNPVLGAVGLATMIFLTLVVNRAVSRRTREGYRRQQASLGRLNGLVEETIGGQKIVQAYSHEAHSIAAFDRANGELRRDSVRTQLFASFTPPLMNSINNLALAISGGLGGIMAVRGLLTIGSIATFLNYTRQFGRPLNELANLYTQFSSAIAGAERVFEIMDQQPEVDIHVPSLPPPGRIRGEVVFDGVTFSYQQGRPILRQVDLRASPGETIALIGPTGAGKTTLINLLTRFYEVDGGRILIDGRDIREVPKSELRRQLGIVLQDTFLFSGTIRENLRYGRLDATDGEIAAAARLANAHAFIAKLPRGYDTPLSERGANLSHGQRQLLSIARAILADPRILILDEATSSIDTRTERQIQEAMRRLMAGRTSFVIAHRLSTIREAHQILVIEEGAVTERGTHGELMTRKGFYYRLSGGLPEEPHPAPLPI